MPCTGWSGETASNSHDNADDNRGFDASCISRRPTVGRYGMAHDIWFDSSHHFNADRSTFALRHICREL